MNWLETWLQISIEFESAPECFVHAGFLVGVRFGLGLVVGFHVQLF